MKRVFIQKALIISTTILTVLLLSFLSYFLFKPKNYEISQTTQTLVSIKSIQTPYPSRFIENKIQSNPIKIYFNNTLLKDNLTSETLNAGIHIQPALKGKFESFYADTLYFTPDKDWIPNTQYTISISPSLIRAHTQLDKKTFHFFSPDFIGNVLSSNFYEDPRDVRLKYAVATFSFSYPIQEKDLKEKIKISSTSGTSFDFTYQLTEEGRVLHVKSSPISLKKESDYIHIEIGLIENAYTTQKLKEKIKAVILVPSISSYFKVEDIQTQIIRNTLQQNKPEQILTLHFSTAVDAKEVFKNTKLYLSDELYCSQLTSKLSKMKEADKNALLSTFKELSLTIVETPQPTTKTHNLIYDFPSADKCLISVIQKSLHSVEGFELGSDYPSFLDPVSYPSESKIAFDGSVIPLKGEKSVSFVSRGIDTLKIRLAQINPKELNHLITQSNGSFSNPYFYGYRFDEENIAEIFEKELPILLEHPAQENYASLNLEEYFKNKKGIFIIKVKGSFQGENKTDEDTRLLLITDLGIIVKDNADGTHAIFVSSIEKEEPVKGALVEVWGKNGQPIIHTKTNEHGFALIESFDGLNHEKTPVVYKVTTTDDLSYIPVQSYERRLDTSRFDVGGIYEKSDRTSFLTEEYNIDYSHTTATQEQLSAYLFSDRLLYRPNEEASFGIIVRQSDLSVPTRLPMRLEVNNPNGNTVATQKITPNEIGFMEYHFAIPPTASLGFYTLNLCVINKENQCDFISNTSFNVQEFAPDTMRLHLEIQNAPAKGWYTQKDIHAVITLQNLYGNPSVAHAVQGNYTLSPASFYFKEYADYLFKDPLRLEGKRIKRYEETLKDVQTDEDGKASFNIDLEPFQTGTYQLNLGVDGLELNSGRGVSTSTSLLVSPNPYLVGYKTDGSLTNIYLNAQRIISFLAIDNQLNSIDISNLTLSVYQKEAVSTLVEMPNGTYQYQRITVDKLQNKTDYTLLAQGSSYTLDTKIAGDYFMQIENKEGQILAKISYTIAGNQNTAYLADKESGLNISLNQKEFNALDTIQMQIKAPYAGYGLITVERDNVYAYKWFQSDTPISIQSIKVPPELEGNAYISVAWIRSVVSPEIFMSPLSYAIVPFNINRAARHLKIDLKTPQTVKPGEVLNIEYQTNQPSQIIIYGVNTGILQVARYKLPQPLDFFMQKKALMVKTMQIVDLILPDSKLVRALKSIGGDGEEDEQFSMRLNPFARKQQKPVAFWSGILTASEKPNIYTYQVPENFNGEIRIMAVGVSQKQMGSSEKSVSVRGDFALIPSGPFNVFPNDIFEVGVSIANMSENAENTTNATVTLLAGKGLEVLNTDTQNATLTKQQESVVRFQVKAKDKLGSVPLIFKVTNIKEPEKTAQVSYDIGIRPDSIRITDIKMGYNSSKLELKNFATPLFEAYREQEVIASSSPLLLTQGLLDYLNRFEHFCTEQSVSKIFPAMEIFFNRPELVKNTDTYALYEDVISKLTVRQNLDGSFKAWNFEWSNSNEFDSLYTLHFLTQAEKHQLAIPSSLKEKALKYAHSVAAKRNSDAFNSNRAYAIYLLTLNGEMTSSYLIQMEDDLNLDKNKEAQKSLSAAYMGAAYKLLQNKEKANILLSRYTLGQNNQEDARFIYLTATHFPDLLPTLSKKGVETLLKPIQNGNFTTISSAYALLALNAFAQEENEHGISFNGQKYTEKGFAKFPFDSTIQTLTIESEKPFFTVISQKGFTKEPISQDLSSGLEVSKEYLDNTGQKIKNPKIGDTITVNIKIRTLNNQYISDIAVTDLLAGCLDIIPNSIKGEINNAEEREDRALIYLSASPAVKEISYQAKVIAKGEFTNPAVFAEALYDPKIRANSVAEKIYVAD